MILKKARRNYEESLTIFEDNDESDGLACIAYQSLGRLLVLQRQFTEAIPFLERGLAIRRGWHEQEGTATNAVYLALACLGCDRLDEVEPLLNEALHTCKDLNYLRGIALCHFAFGLLEAKRGDHSRPSISINKLWTY